MTPQPPAVTGVLSLLGHPSLGFELLHGEPLYILALRALEAALGGEPLVVVRRPDVARVAADAKEASDKGISGVPTFVFAQKYAVSGAQPAEQLARAIRDVSAEVNAQAAE